MTWQKIATNELSSIKAKFPDGIETDYVDPVIGRTLAEHLKTYWLIRESFDYSAGYEAAKVRELLEPEKFTERDWLAISKVCGFSRAWAYKQIDG